MMREDAKHRWRIEYCDTGKQEPDVLDDNHNGNRHATIVTKAAAVVPDPTAPEKPETIEMPMR